MKYWTMFFFATLMWSCSSTKPQVHVYEVFVDDQSEASFNSTHYTLKSQIDQNTRIAVTKYEVSNVVMTDSVRMTLDWKTIESESNRMKKVTKFLRMGDTLAITGTLDQKIFLPEQPIMISAMDSYIAQNVFVENTSMGFFDPAGMSITYFDIYPLGMDTINWRSMEVPCQKTMVRNGPTVFEYWMDNEGAIVQKVVTYKNEIIRFVRMKD